MAARGAVGMRLASAAAPAACMPPRWPRAGPRPPALCGLAPGHCLKLSRHPSRPHGRSQRCTASAADTPDDSTGPRPLRIPRRVAGAAKQASSLVLPLTVGTVIATGVINRLLYKMSLMPLGSYVFFLAQLQTVGYVLFYLAFLLVRRRMGLVTDAMLRIPRRMAGLFVGMGLAEALSSLLAFIGAANLPGVVLPLLSQTVLFWQVLLAYLVLRRRLGPLQLSGIALVAGGVAMAGWPRTASSSVLTGVDPMYAGIYTLSMLFPAIDTIIKERVFRTSRVLLGQDLDLFVLNTYASAAQAAWVFLLLPVVTAAQGMALSEMPQYLANGWQCFQGITPECGGDCSGAPLLPLLYVAFNLAFNISALALIRQSGNVVMSLVMSCVVPLTLFAFTQPLPYLAPAPPLGPSFLAGVFVLMAGLMAYNGQLLAPALRKWLASSRAHLRAQDGGGGPGTGVVA